MGIIANAKGPELPFEYGKATTSETKFYFTVLPKKTEFTNIVQHQVSIIQKEERVEKKKSKGKK